MDGGTDAATSSSKTVSVVDGHNTFRGTGAPTLKEELVRRVPVLKDAGGFRELRRVLRADYGGLGAVRAELTAAGFVENGRLTTGTKPFNLFARIAAGEMQQPGMQAEQAALRDHGERFVVCKNRPENDAHWDSEDPEWLGKASMAQRHRFLTTKDLRWRFFNVLTMGMAEDGERPAAALREALELLAALRQAAVAYATDVGGWSEQLGLYVHVFGHNSVNSLHLHLVDMKAVGPTMKKLDYKNCPLNAVLEVLQEELLATEKVAFSGVELSDSQLLELNVGGEPVAISLERLWSWDAGQQVLERLAARPRDGQGRIFLDLPAAPVKVLLDALRMQSTKGRDGPLRLRYVDEELRSVAQILGFPISGPGRWSPFAVAVAGVLLDSPGDTCGDDLAWLQLAQVAGAGPVFLARERESCSTACGGDDKCDIRAMNSLGYSDLNPVAPRGCSGGQVSSTGVVFAPYLLLSTSQCIVPSGTSVCGIRPDADARRFCVCLSTTQSTTQYIPIPGLVLAEEGATCSSTCGGDDRCNIRAMDSLGFSDLNALAPGGCYRGQVEVTRDTGAPLLADAERGQQYCYVPQSGSTDCGARVETRTGRRVCVCLLAVLAPEGESCSSLCGGDDRCDIPTMNSLGYSDLNPVAPRGCSGGQVVETRDAFAPYLLLPTNQCIVPSGTSVCGIQPDDGFRRFCVCLTTTTSSTTTTYAPPPGLTVAEEGATCSSTCGGDDQCNLPAMNGLDFFDLNPLVPGGCYNGRAFPTRDSGAPLLADVERGIGCFVPQNPGSAACGAPTETPASQRVCVCLVAILAPEGTSCSSVCGGDDRCDIPTMNRLGFSDLNPTAPGGCRGEVVETRDGFAPTFEVESNRCLVPSITSDCAVRPTAGYRRFCVCNTVTTTTGGGGQGDPHIRSILGAHYTLMQEGIFVAWNFSKVIENKATKADWQLFAAYSGNRFTTQGLMLVDKHSGQTMELMAEDCAWRVKQKDTWRKVQLELLSGQDGATVLSVQKLLEEVDAQTLKSVIILRMESGRGMQDVAKLVVHCEPHNHLDFKIGMYEKDDIGHVGGELGVPPNANNNYHFLFTRSNMIEMRNDQEFKAAGTWATLGGSDGGAHYLNSQQQAGAGFLASPCTDAEAEDAKALCSRHLQESQHPEIFADCVFDLCHGADEQMARSAAAFISA